MDVKEKQSGLCPVGSKLTKHTPSLRNNQKNEGRDEVKLSGKFIKIIQSFAKCCGCGLEHGSDYHERNYIRAGLGLDGMSRES